MYEYFRFTIVKDKTLLKIIEKILIKELNPKYNDCTVFNVRN